MSRLFCFRISHLAWNIGVWLILVDFVPNRIPWISHFSSTTTRRSTSSSLSSSSSSSSSSSLSYSSATFWGVEAICSIQDENNNPVSLRSLPTGVEYESKRNRLECRGVSSCRGWTIMGCSVVQCQNRHACFKTTFIGNQGVACWDHAACHETKFVDSHNVACGGSTSIRSSDMDHQNSPTCSKAVIETDAVVFCVGPNACVSSSAEGPGSDDQNNNNPGKNGIQDDHDKDKWYNRMVFKVEETGMIRCENSGIHSYACQNMIVQVDDGNRACIAYELPPEKQRDVGNLLSIKASQFWDKLNGSGGGGNSRQDDHPLLQIPKYDYGKADQNCAVVCPGGTQGGECDAETILFQLLEA